ncbi:hypothetical protein JYU34_016498 [Plutella xylostella]|uniref:Uncharacterized protein n=1 Tax=Plutella xylostella TaxID=51655 RepID=A0ABQ7Q470_PLUXY|nr:hypothetical protein JYU34_016498 [Plutella xylostella]
MYHSDTVYSTTTFRPVSPLPRPPPAPLPPPPPPPPPPATPSPQRTRKLETPLHFEGGLFSDIRSTEGKLLSKVTVDRVHSSSRHDVTESPGPAPTARDYVDDVTKTETITNEDVIKIRFTPVVPELDVPRLLTPSQFIPLPPQVEYIKDDFEDLKSYKMVNSVCKGNKFESDALCDREKSVDSLSNIYNFEPMIRPHSPLANFIVPEQLTKIDEYLQKSLDEHSNDGEERTMSPTTEVARREAPADNTQLHKESNVHEQIIRSESKSMNVSSYQGRDEPSINKTNAVKMEEKYDPPVEKFDRKRKSKVDSANDKNTGVLRAIYNMPIHYHAIILCVLLIVYNLVYQYIKQHCQVKGK